MSEDIGYALTGSAKNAFETAKWLQKVSEARSDAEQLCDSVLQLRGLSSRLGRLLEQYQDEVSNPLTSDTLSGFEASLRTCERALNTLDRLGRPLSDDDSRTWGRRIKYVWNSDLRKDQQLVIDRKVNEMHLNLTILTNIKTDVPRAVLPLNETLFRASEEGQEAVEQRVKDLEIPKDAEEEVDLGLPSSQEEEKVKLWKFPKHLEGQSGGALFVAVACSSSDEVKRMLDGGCDPNLRDDHKRTLLHRTCQNLDLQSLTHLLEVRARLPEGCLDAADDRGDTALMLLAKQADQETSLPLAEALLKAGCDPNRVNESETARDALYFAMDAPKQEDRVAFVKMLVNDFNADTSIIKDAFPRATRQYLGSEDAVDDNEDALEDDRDNNDSQAPERKQSLLNRVARRLSRGATT
jgi:hypothetical protein